MNKPQFIGIVGVMAILLGVAFWWITSEIKGRNNPLNKYDAFVYSDGHILYWLELSTSRSGEVEGNLYQKRVIEEVGKEPYMKKSKRKLIGKKTDNGYEFREKISGKIITFDAWFSGGNLFMEQKGTTDKKSYKAINKNELNKYEREIQQELEMAIYHAEEKEKNRIKNFFSKLRNVYGYLYSPENGSYQLFIKIDEALLQGEISGSLLIMTETGDKEHPYEEAKYELNGITDGQILQLYTTVDGKETKLKGHFYKDATSFDLSFWKSDHMLTFHAVNEDEFKQAFDKRPLK